MWIERGIVTIVKNLDIWLGIVGIEGQRIELEREEGKKTGIWEQEND